LESGGLGAGKRKQSQDHSKVKERDLNKRLSPNKGSRPKGGGRKVRECCIGGMKENITEGVLGIGLLIEK